MRVSSENGKSIGTKELIKKETSNKISYERKS